MSARAIPRPWINQLQDYMPDSKRQELKEACEASGFEMTRKYQDSSGATRVLGAY